MPNPTPVVKPAGSSAAPTPVDLEAAIRAAEEAAKSPKLDLPEVSVRNREANDPMGYLDLDQRTLDPSRHYRWVRCRSDEHMITVTQTKFAGYKIETYREGGPRPIAELDKRPDNVIAVGDLILMSCDLGQYKRREQDRQNKTEALLASASAQTEQMAKDKGIKFFHDPDSR